MSNIVLVNPKVPVSPYFAQKELFPSGALLLLGTILKKAGHKVEVIHEAADGFRNRGFLIKSIARKSPDIVGITVTTFNCRSARDLCIGVKKCLPKCLVVVGGPHTSALGREGILYPPEADTWIVGEGDTIILDIAEGKVPPGLHSPEPLKSLEDTPIPDFNLIDIRKFSGTYPPGPLPGMFVMGSRGCPFSCTFCSRAVFGKTSRQRTPEATVEEAEKLVKDLKVKEVFFHDDTFNLRPSWTYEVLRLIRQKGLDKKVTFRTPCRVNEPLVSLDLLKEMKATNFWLIFFGVENGNQKMLDRMKKGISIEEVERAFSLCHKVGIKPEASFIIGMPGETPYTIIESERLWKRIKPFWASFSRAIPFPGTELYNEVKQVGHLLEPNLENFGVNRMLVRTEALGACRLEYEASRLDRLVLREKILNLLKTHPSRLLRIVKDASESNSPKEVISRIKRFIV